MRRGGGSRLSPDMRDVIVAWETPLPGLSSYCSMRGYAKTSPTLRGAVSGIRFSCDGGARDGNLYPRPPRNLSHESNHVRRTPRSPAIVPADAVVAGALRRPRQRRRETGRAGRSAPPVLAGTAGAPAPRE